MSSGTLVEELPSSAYVDADVFETEMAHLRSKSWTFVALTRDIAAPNDYLTLDVAGRSVILQNFEGTYKAFDNICSHRQCQIRTEAKGNGILRCPYHSWVYNHAGIPVGIPFAAEAFDLGENDRASLALHAWRVECCGELIFIRRDAGGLDLASELGDLYPELHKIQNCLGEEVDSLETEYKANWKVCIENTIDEYHVWFVHQTTFKTMIEKTFEYKYFGTSSGMTVSATDEYLAKWKKVDRLISSRSLNTTNYFQYLVFPTMTIASAFGATFSLQRMLPVAPDTTILSSRLFFAKTKASPAVIASLGEAAMSFNRTVFEEDRVICNQVQLGLKHATKNAVLGNFDKRISHFRASVMAKMHMPAGG